MHPQTSCSACGMPIPDGLRQRHCPACLLKAGLETEVAPVDAGAFPESIGNAAATPAPRELPGTMIGRYKLLEEIGEGGFGIVYMAEQTVPVKRRVALKVIKPGMDTREVVARFAAERQALAVMDHPNIARIFDGGTTESGRPYVVMELVNGMPLTKYCDEHRLTHRQRLELFLDVLSAVQHAHQKGVIHRDLKPSNILVSLPDGNTGAPPGPSSAAVAGGTQHSQDGSGPPHHGRPRVKVIDFGIAKALTADPAQGTLFTGLGQMIGTPQYASPEQAGSNALDVDTRSDLYSLGVVLYELLTGRTPLDGKMLRSAALAEMQRLIREQEPPKPSAVPASMTVSERTTVARRRQADPEKLTPLLRGDLDWVVMKALDKNRSRRYQTAIGFALDIHRFLNDEPVSASPPSLHYRFSKFARRHRFAVAWIATVSLVVLTAAIGMTILFFKVERERKNAEREKEQAIEARKVAQSRRWEALAAQLQALLSGKRAGRRMEAFAALKEATAIPEGMAVPANMAKLRNAAIACLAIVDMPPGESWPGNPGRNEIVAANRAFNAYATSFPDGRIAIHSYPGKMLLAELPGEGAEPMRLLQFSADGTRLAAASKGSESGQWNLKLWSVPGGGAPTAAGAGVNKAFDFFPDGNLCAVGRRTAAGAVLEVISAASAEVQRQMALPATPYSVGVSRDGRWIAVSFQQAGTTAAESGLVEIRDAGSGLVVASLNVPEPHALAWGPLGNSLAVGSADRQVRVWHDEQWAAKPLEFDGHTRAVDAVAWSPDGRLLASCGWDGTVRLWDPFQGTLLCWRHGRCGALQFSPDGTELGFLHDGEILTVLKVVPGDVCHRGPRHSGDVGTFAAVWNAEGTLMATSGNDGVRLWNREGRQLAFVDRPKSRGLAFAKDALFVACVDGVFRWPMQAEAAGNEVTVVFQKPEAVGAFRNCEQIVLSPDETLLAVAGAQGAAAGNTLWLVDLKNNQAVRGLGGPAGATFCAMSQNGLWLAAGTWKGNGVRLWKLPEADAPVDLPVHGSASVGFSPDDHWLVTGDTEAYRFWKMGTWELEKQIPSGMSEHYGRMAFSAQRKTVMAIACQRDELKVIELLHLTELTAPDFDREAPLCFDPAGLLLVTSGETGTFFWQLDAVRDWLKKFELDWGFLPLFKAIEFPVVRRVVVPAQAE